MHIILRITGAILGRGRAAGWGMAALLLSALAPMDAQALPAFARQTGQGCVSCHAGGQFPELTPYGRMFKMTGYTLGTRTIPLAVMGVVNYAKVADTSKSDNSFGPGGDFVKNAVPMFATGSLFIAGKITDNLGAFTQISYDNYASQGGDGQYHGHTNMDNVDLRYADHFIGNGQDLVLGVSFNNNPSVSDPWNTAAAWMQYVPPSSVSSHQFADAYSPYPAYGGGIDHLAGLTAYLYWNRTLYAEIGTYRSPTGALSFLNWGVADMDRKRLQGSNNPYWRVALTRDWGPHNFMIGATGMIVHRYDDPTNTTDPTTVARFKDTGVDAQYQYLLDPHTVTAQMSYTREVVDYSASALANYPAKFVDAAGNPLPNPNPSDTTNILRLKATYVYQAKYGGSIAFFNRTGTTNTLNMTSGYDPTGLISSDDPNGTGVTSMRVIGSLSGNPGTKGFTYEAFWMPVQYVRVGAQYTAYSKFNGASSNYDGFGRNASDNNTLFLYLWGAY